MLEDAISRVETEATTKRKTTEESGGAPVRPTDIGTTPMSALPSLASLTFPFRLAQQLQQLGDVGRNPPFLIAREQFRRRSPPPAHPRESCWPWSRRINGKTKPTAMTPSPTPKPTASTAAPRHSSVARTICLWLPASKP
jgi:hypothetical protein